jgi:putative zinc finger/helix-turn-helix YgiT family protein
MKEKLECAFCEGEATLLRKPRELSYRKEEFHVFEHYYQCSKCTEEFTTTESDTLTMVQVYNQYRERHHIPFAEEIIRIREQYGLAASKMSEVLGLGVNGYSNYEKGEIPIEGYGNLIRLAADPQVFRTMLLKSKTIFTDNAFRSILGRVEALADGSASLNPVNDWFNHETEAGRYTGYRTPSMHKAVQLLLYFVSQCKREYNDKLKLNKLLFYADFLHYKNTGYSVTGITYRAIQYGPVPSNYDFLFAYLEKEGMMESQWKQVKGASGTMAEIFAHIVEPDLGLLSAEEVETLHHLTGLFANTSSGKMIEISHLEKAWIHLHAEKKLIDYQEYAFELKAV